MSQDNNELTELNPLLFKQILKPGVGSGPQNQQEVLFHYVLRDENKNLLSGTELQHLSITIGQNQTHWYIEETLKSMAMGERCLVQIKNPQFLENQVSESDKQQYAFEIFQEQKTLELEIEIIRFGNIKNNNWDLNSEQRLMKAELLKQEGNSFIKAQKYLEAKETYSQALQIINNDDFQELINSLLNNLSLSQLKLNDYENCIKTCLKALDTQTDNIKLYYRLGLGYIGNEEFDEAKQTFLQGLKIDPTSVELKKELENLKITQKKILQKKQAQFSKMFQ